MNQKDFTLSRNFNTGLYGVRAVVLFLREMFTANPDLGFNIYTDDLAKADAFLSLHITTKHDWETKYRGKRPIIFVSRGNLITGVNNTQGIGRVLSITNNGQVTSYSDLISFPIVVECLSESDIESETLSSIVLTLLTGDTRALRSLGLQIQGNPIQTPTQLFEKVNNSFISSVIIQVQVQRQMRAIRTPKNLLESIEFKINDGLEVNIKED
jgi:hypothetical protein